MVFDPDEFKESRFGRRYCYFRLSIVVGHSESLFLNSSIVVAIMQGHFFELVMVEKLGLPLEF